MEDGENENLLLVLKTYTGVKPHSPEESGDKVVEVERDKYDNDEHVYYFLMEDHLQEAEDGMGDGVGWLVGRWGVTLYFLYIVKFSCRGCIRRRVGLPICKRDRNSRISIMDC